MIDPPFVRDTVMKKSRKVLVRGSGFNMHRNQNYPCGKLESFVVSGRFESEMASEDSSTNKRKSVNLSCAGNKTDALGIPVHVFPISQMSRSEKIELRNRLKLELDQTRSTRQKIESKEFQVTSSGSVPIVSDGHISRLEGRCSESNPVKGGTGPCAVQASGSYQVDNCLGSQGVVQTFAKEKRNSIVNQHYLNSKNVSSNSKIPSAEKPNSKGSVKRGLLEGFESRNRKRQRVELVQIETYTEQMQQCADILNKLMSHRFGWVFNAPVNPVKLKIPDYFKIITEPMDLGTIKTKLEMRRYLSPIDFASDVRLTLANAMKYNPPTNDVHQMAVTLKKLFERNWSVVETRLAGEEVYKKITQGVQLIPTKKQLGKTKISEIENKSKVSSDVNCVPASTVPFEQKPKAEICRPPMSFIEKAKLSKDLEALSANMPERVYNFLKKHTGLTQCEDEVEVDIDSFNDNNLWELQILVSNCLRDRGQGAKFSQVSEPVKLHADSGAAVGSGCKSPKIAQQDGGARGEYVHVGGDDMQAINFPKVDSEEVTAASIKSSSSSSSSSSDSGSSSSDSDSESSSGSDLATDEVHYADAHPEESVDFTTGNKQMVQSDPETTGVKSAVSVLDEDSVYPKAAVSVIDAAQQEGESAPRWRQVSPDKLLRAAMLKSRFADTILKAQEKTLKQHNSGDPEKLRREKEELEKSQREEKARIQAESKAAEAEAAATAKQKREMEREAARLALQKMEKTVEIEENNQILKDLERLSYVPGDHIPSCGDEISTVSSVDGLVTFPLQGRNPLEQLGLFIKSDEEEETISDCAAGNGLVEEGEID
ncbi:hypothetical protein SUGI_0928710 [Cryptomeria japonica]|uniref:transcription factor GTE9 n=1 Tax=Cryptomeria japonica TaxID=3369 RepID=UPI002414C81D|nr:transcription factor GTE9 [Cryptomeria japonica]GLJ44345.1 hypothetical protein SUGI_0928710 [Cryptomeria japonica]